MRYHNVSKEQYQFAYLFVKDAIHSQLN